MVDSVPANPANSPLHQQNVSEMQGPQTPGAPGAQKSGPAPVLSDIMNNIFGKGALPALAKPGMASGAAVLLLMKLRNESTDLQLKSSEGVIKNEASRKKEQHEERMQKLEESAKAMEKAEKGGVFGKVFSWVATGALAVAGAALVATGAGAVAGAIMLAMAADMAYSQISGDGSMMSKATAELANGLEKMGIPQPGATIAATILVTAIVIVATAGASSAATTAKTAATAAKAAKAGKAASTTSNTAQTTSSAAQLGGTAAKATSAATKASNAASIASNTTQTTSSTAQLAAQSSRLSAIAAKVGKMANLTQSAAQMGTASSNIAVAKYTKDAAMSAADAKAIQAMLAKIQATMEEETDRLKDILQKLEANASTVMQILAGDDDTAKNIIARMNKA